MNELGAASRPTRRILLKSGLGGLLAALAAVVGRPQAVGAAGQPVEAGGSVSTTSPTKIFYNGSARALEIYADPGGTSVYAHGGNGTAVDAFAGGIAVKAWSSEDVALRAFANRATAVLGDTEADGPVGAVVGQSRRARAYGVFGVNLGSGTRASLAGPTAAVATEVPDAAGFVAVSASAPPAATALAVTGRATFSRSGRASLPAGRAFLDVAAPGGLDLTSLVLAVLMANRPGTYVQAVVPNSKTGRFRINLNRVASKSTATPIAWFIVN